MGYCDMKINKWLKPTLTQMYTNIYCLRETKHMGVDMNITWVGHMFEEPFSQELSISSLPVNMTFGWSFQSIDSVWIEGMSESQMAVHRDKRAPSFSLFLAKSHGALVSKPSKLSKHFLSNYQYAQARLIFSFESSVE